MPTANYLSSLRILLAPFVAIILLLNASYEKFFVVSIILVAIISDILDGYIARKQGTESKFGVFLDETADKIFVTCILIPLVVRGQLQSWIVLTIICSWFAISGFRSYASLKGTVVSPNVASKIVIIFIFSAILLAVIDFPFTNLIFAMGIAFGIVSFIYIVFVNREYRSLIFKGFNSKS